MPIHLDGGVRRAGLLRGSLGMTEMKAVNVGRSSASASQAAKGSSDPLCDGLGDFSRRLFEMSLDPMTVVGFDGCFIQLNAAWEDVLGYPFG